MIVFRKGYEAMRRRQLFAAAPDAPNMVFESPEPLKESYRAYEAETSEAAQEVKGHMCVKCGKIFRQGWWSHERYCKG